MHNLIVNIFHIDLNYLQELSYRKQIVRQLCTHYTSRASWPIVTPYSNYEI